LDVNHGRFCIHDGDQFVEGQVEATNFEAEAAVPSFTIIFGGDGSVKN